MAKGDLPDVLSRIFLREGLDRVLLICPSGSQMAGANMIARPNL
jgi:hypothetical protein